MSKKLAFEILSLVEMPRSVFQRLKEDEAFEEIRLLKHFSPNYQDEYKQDKKWSELEQTRKECREEQKEIESRIRVDRC